MGGLAEQEKAQSLFLTTKNTKGVVDHEPCDSGPIDKAKTRVASIFVLFVSFVVFSTGIEFIRTSRLARHAGCVAPRDIAGKLLRRARNSLP